MTTADLTRAAIDAEVAGIIAASDDASFRRGVRAWLEAALPRIAGTNEWRRLALERDFRLTVETALCRAGFSGLGWPRAYGGHELPLARQAIFLEEYARIEAPLPINMIGHGIVAPTLLAYGSESQKERLLPRLLDNGTLWCQGYSEPGTGSDLASLSTRAVACEGGYRLNGQKVWTSFADLAGRCFALARTGTPDSRHRGISVFLVDMTSEGVTVEPIRQITGDADYCAVFFDDVFVADDDRLGDENAGWSIAMAAAGFERGTYFIPRIVRLRSELDRVVELARDITHEGVACIDHPDVRREIGVLARDCEALRSMADDMLRRTARHEAPGAEGSVIKLLWSETHQRLYELAMEIIGPEALLGPGNGSASTDGHVQYLYLWTRAETILAGTSEIMRNIIAERGLGLPR